MKRAGPIPRICKCYLCRKRFSADGIELRILRLRDYFALSGWALNVTTSVLIREKQTGLTHMAEKKAM